MTLIRAIAAWLSFFASVRVEAGIATRFAAHGDLGNPRPWAACLRRNMRDSRDAIVAHRTLPCLTRVIVCLPRTGRCTKSIIGERGPYGRTGRRYTAMVDLSPIVSRRLGHNGREMALLWVIE